MFSGAKLLWAGILLGIDYFVKPSLSLFTVVLIAIALDFATGIMKAWFKKEARTSEGYRKTVVKIMQYAVPILVLYLAGKRIPEYHKLLTDASGYLMMFIIYIEVTSIFENLYDIDKKTVVSKYLYKPMLMILKFGIEKNPDTQAADKIAQEQEKKEEENEKKI